MCQEIYKTNQFLRKPLRMQELRYFERSYRKQIADLLKEQNHAIVTEEFVTKIFNKYQSLKGVRRAQSERVEPSDYMLDAYIDEQLDNHPVLKEDSKDSNKMKALLLLLLLGSMSIGLLYDKKRLIKQLASIDDERIPELIDRINLGDVKITNVKIKELLKKYSAGVTVGLNEVTKDRIKVFIYDGISKGKTAEEVVRKIGTLDKMSTRRAATVARTEIMNAKAQQTRIYFDSMGIEFWVWRCSQPEDVGCLGNCGLIRKVGDSFPSGHSEPTVHPNCQCYMEAWIPSDSAALELFVTLMLAGQDWSGGDIDEDMLDSLE